MILNTAYSQRLSLITLLFKKKKKRDPQILNNYRPKSLVKLIKNLYRLQIIFDKSIHINQSADIKGRNRGLYARFIVDILIIMRKMTWNQFCCSLIFKMLLIRQSGILCLMFSKNSIPEKTFQNGLTYYITNLYSELKKWMDIEIM